MIINREVECALAICAYLYPRKKSLVSSSTIAKKLKYGLPFVRKTGGKLARAGIISTTEGVNGGYKLVGYPIILTVVEAIKPITVANISRKKVGSKLGLLALKLECSVGNQLRKSVRWLCQ